MVLHPYSKSHRPTYRGPISTIKDDLRAFAITCKPKKLYITGTYDHTITKFYTILDLLVYIQVNLNGTRLHRIRCLIKLCVQTLFFPKYFRPMHRAAIDRVGDTCHKHSQGRANSWNLPLLFGFSETWIAMHSEYQVLKWGALGYRSSDIGRR